MPEKDYDQNALDKILRVRIGQLIINEMYKKGDFKVPIHLALGHEAVAVAVDFVMQRLDQLILSHRNIHYNLARADSFRSEVDEYLLKKEGMACGQMGSMNLNNPEKGVPYTSSILGNNLAVAAGFAMANAVAGRNGVVFVVTGDGAMEEGTFYESLLFEKSNALPVIVIVENNQWSLATRIEERRCAVDLESFSGALSVPFKRFSSNDVYEYIEEMKVLRALAVEKKTPVCAEVMLTTLGSWRQPTAECPEGKFINYHAGPSRAVSFVENGILENSNNDPVYVMGKYFKQDMIKDRVFEIFSALKKEIE